MIARTARPRVYLVGQRVGDLDVSELVLEFTVQKQLGPGSAFSLTLIAQDAEKDAGYTSSFDRLVKWWEQVELNDLVSFGYQRDGGIGVGFVGSIELVERYVGEQLTRAVQISGGMEDRPLSQDQVVKASLTAPELRRWYDAVEGVFGSPDHPLLIALEGAWGPRVTGDRGDLRSIMLGATVEDFARWVLDRTTSVQIPLLAYAYGVDVAAQAYQIEGPTRWNAQRIWTFAPQTYQGNVWGFVASVIDEAFYELRADSRPREGEILPELVLVLRPKPWDDPALSWAPVQEGTGYTVQSTGAFVSGRVGGLVLAREEVQELTLGRSDQGVSNVYIVSSEHLIGGSGQALSAGLFFPLVDLWSARRFGTRPMRASVSMLGADPRAKQRGEDGAAPGEGGQVRQIEYEIRDFRNRLFNWHRFEPWFLQGRVVTAGRDRYRPGDWIELPWVRHPLAEQDGIRAYCVGVAWRWVYGGELTSALTLQRGYSDGAVEAFNAQVQDEARLLRGFAASRLRDAIPLDLWVGA